MILNVRGGLWYEEKWGGGRQAGNLGRGRGGGVDSTPNIPLSFLKTLYCTF